MKTLVFSGLIVISISSEAFALELTPGTYVGHLSSGCATMTVKNGGKTVDYKYGACGGAATYHHGGTFDGTVISIQAARLRVKSANETKIKGTWTLGNYTTSVTFKRN
jgi:hypothetical protein